MRVLEKGVLLFDTINDRVVVADIQALRELPVGSVVRDSTDKVYQKRKDGWWGGLPVPALWENSKDPLELLFVPGDGTLVEGHNLRLERKSWVTYLNG